MEGYIKDWRQELESDIWLMPPMYHRVWQFLKYSANHTDEYVPMRDGTKVLVKRGQRLTSVRNIADGVGYYERGIFKKPNPKTVQSILDWLVQNGMISIDTGNRKYTLVTILNYSIYQAKDSDKSNSWETVGKQSLDINKNDKEDSIYIFNKQNSCQDIEKVVDNLKKDFGDNYKIELAGLKTKKLAEYESQGISTITALVKFDKWFKGTYGCTYDEALTL